MAASNLHLGVGLGLAVCSSAAVNLGFLLQHRGLRGVSGLRASFASRTWLSGQALGTGGFGAQVAAVAIAPLSLVQAFSAGGLALSVPLASGLFGHRVRRGEALAVLAIAASLAVLPVGLPDRREHLHAGVLSAATGGVFALALALAWRPGAGRRSLAAGLAYGVVDAAIKAISVHWSAHGAASLLSGWTAVALLGTLAGFLAFQSALRSGSAVAATSLMTAGAALVALGCGLAAFGESFGTSAGVILLHAAAVAVVLGSVPRLAVTQAELAS